MNNPYFSFTIGAAYYGQVRRLGDALKLAFGFLKHPEQKVTITNCQTGMSHIFHFVNTDFGSITVSDAQALLKMAGFDPRENDDDGFHWPRLTMSVFDAAEALNEWTKSIVDIEREECYAEQRAERSRDQWS